MLHIIVSRASSRATPSRHRSRTSSPLFTTTCGAEVRAALQHNALIRLSTLLSGTRLLHQLLLELAVFVVVLADAVLRHPVVPGLLPSLVVDLVLIGRVLVLLDLKNGGVIEHLVVEA